MPHGRDKPIEQPGSTSYWRKSIWVATIGLLVLIGILALWFMLINLNAAWVGGKNFSAEEDFHTQPAIRPVGDDDNLFVGIAAFRDPGSGDLTVAGRRIIDELNARRAQSPDALDLADEYADAPDWHTPTTWPTACNHSQDTCGRWAAAHPDEARSFLDQHQKLLSVYRAVAQRRAYRNTLTEPTDATNLHLGPLIAGAKLYRIWANTQAQSHGTDALIAELENQLQGSRALLADSSTLLEKLIAAAYHAQLLVTVRDLMAFGAPPPGNAMRDLSNRERAFATALKTELDWVSKLTNGSFSERWDERILSAWLNEPATRARLRAT